MINDINRFPIILHPELIWCASISPQLPEMTQFRPPEKMNFREPRWDAWRSSFQTFRIISELDKESDSVQIATLKYSMGPEADDIFKTFEIKDTHNISYDSVLAMFDTYFKPKKNLVKLRQQFHNRCQEDNETIDSFKSSLTTAAEECNFYDKEERILDQFIFGLQNKVVKGRIEHLYVMNPIDFTLDKVIEYVKTHSEVVPERTTNLKREQNSACRKCGRNHSAGKCEAYGNICSKCYQLNHLTFMCPNPKPFTNSNNPKTTETVKTKARPISFNFKKYEDYQPVLRMTKDDCNF